VGISFVRRLVESAWEKFWILSKNPAAEKYRDRQIVALLTRLPWNEGWGVDLGGRDGRHGAALGARVVTPDWNPQRGGGSILLQADVHALPIRSESIRFAFSISLLELLRDGERFLQETRRILEPGAPFLLTIPNFRSPHFFFWFFRDVLLRGMAVHQRRYHREEVLHLLRRSGLDLLQSGGFIFLPFSLLEHLPGPLLAFFSRLDQSSWPRANPSWCSYYYFLAVRREDAA